MRLKDFFFFEILELLDYSKKRIYFTNSSEQERKNRTFDVHQKF